MNNITVNNIPHHKILSGFEFDSFMPSSNCDIKKITFGKGCEAHKEVVTTIKESYKDTEDIAKILERDTLLDTCITIKDFLYNYIQYNHDDKLNIKSPSCVWSSRKAECKSNTIFASTILVNLGIKHYLRSVYYSGVGRHIYIVVPTNQVTGDLNEKSYLSKNYHTIDGTFKYHFEPHFDAKVFDRFIDPGNIENTNVSCEVKSDKRMLIIGLSIVSSIMLLSKG